MTPERRAEIESLLKGATKSWFVAHTSSGTEFGEHWVGVTHMTSEYDYALLPESDDQLIRPSDAFLIEQAPTIIRELLAEIDRLTEYEWKYNDLCK